MQDKRYIICGNAPTSGIEENPERDLRLRLWGKDGPDKITLRIEDIHKKMSKDVPDSFQDLLEIATYVYSADQAIPRGADDVDSLVTVGGEICISSFRSGTRTSGMERRFSRPCARRLGSCLMTAITSDSPS